MNDPIQTSTTGNPGNGAGGKDTAVSGDRIDQSAERVKHATSSAVAGTKDAVDRAADRVEGSVHRATDRAAGAAHRASDRASELSDRSREMMDQGREKADEWLAEARDYVREKPVQSVAMALGAGWLLGRILRR